MEFRKFINESTIDDENQTRTIITKISDLADKLEVIMKKYKSPTTNKVKKDFTIALSGANDFFNEEFGAEK